MAQTTVTIVQALAEPINLTTRFFSFFPASGLAIGDKKMGTFFSSSSPDLFSFFPMLSAEVIARTADTPRC